MATSGWSIKLDTSRDGIADKLTVFKAQPDVITKKAVLDKTGKVVTPAEVQPAYQEHLEAVKISIADKVSKLPEEFDGVLVIASGQCDLTAGRMSESVQIIGKKNHL